MVNTVIRALRLYYFKSLCVSRRGYIAREFLHANAPVGSACGSAPITHTPSICTSNYAFLYHLLWSHKMGRRDYALVPVQEISDACLCCSLHLQGLVFPWSLQMIHSTKASHVPPCLHFGVL